jgi:hypothetical protein
VTYEEHVEPLRVTALAGRRPLSKVERPRGRNDARIE